MRSALLALSTALAALAIAPAATAVNPERDIVPAPDDVVITGQCAFPVLGHIEGDEINTTFFDSSRNPIKLIAVFPGQTLTLTSMVTAESITVTDAGSSQVRAEPDGSVKISIMGHGPLPDEIVGGPGLWYLNGGRVVVVVDTEGNPTSIVVSGNVVNLCDRLSP